LKVSGDIYVRAIDRLDNSWEKRLNDLIKLFYHTALIDGMSMTTLTAELIDQTALMEVSVVLSNLRPTICPSNVWKRRHIFEAKDEIET